MRLLVTVLRSRKRPKAHVPQARGHALGIAQTMWDRRMEFRFDQEVAATVDEALDLAQGAPESSVSLDDGLW